LCWCVRPSLWICWYLHCQKELQVFCPIPNLWYPKFYHGSHEWSLFYSIEKTKRSLLSSSPCNSLHNRINTSLSSPLLSRSSYPPISNRFNNKINVKRPRQLEKIKFMVRRRWTIIRPFLINKLTLSLKNT
jgi:hypothetical protein